MALFITYLAIKYARRARFVRLLRVAHISPDELKDKLEADANVVIVDLRLHLDFGCGADLARGDPACPGGSGESSPGDSA